MLSYIYVFLVLVTFSFTCIIIKQTNLSWRQSYNPFVFLAGALVFYTFSPLVENLGKANPVFDDFLLMQLTAVIGMSCGALYAHLRHPVILQHTGVNLSARFGSKSIVVAQIVGIGFLLFSYEFFYGGLSNILQFSYREIYAAEAYRSAWEFIAHVLVQFGMPAMLLVVYMTGVRRTLFFVSTAIYVLLLFASGTRNLVVMFAGNLLLFSSLVYHRMSYFKLGVAAVVAFALMMIAGVYRNFGLNSYTDFFQLISVEGWRLLNPNSQELGTSYNVFRINYSNPFWYDLAFGESYLNALLSVVPTFLWPSRPNAVGHKFSAHFADPGEGLGFSNNLEAYLNGGLPLVFLVNFLLLYVAIWMYNRFIVRRITLFGLAFYGNLVFVSFNWNRIDFQTVFKISLIRIALFYAIAILLLKITRNWQNGSGAVRRTHKPSLCRSLVRETK